MLYQPLVSNLIKIEFRLKMSVSLYFPGRNKRPASIKVDRAESELEDILSGECLEANSPYCRYILEN